MIKRPINSIFREKILAREKISTIRAKQWPLCTPIMLFSWEDKPYRSKHKDLAVITVQAIYPITISRSASNVLAYSYSSREGSCSEMSIFSKPLFQVEGFDSAEQMDEWFTKLLIKDESINQFLMLFSLCNSFCNSQLNLP